MARQSSVTTAIKEQIDIVAYARQLGLDPIPHGTQGKYRSRVHDSLILDPKAGAFSWNSQGVHGSVIDLAMAFQSISLDSAISQLRQLLNNTPGNQSLYRKPSNVREPPAPREVQLPPKGENGYKRIFAYLTKTRHIDPGIVQEMVDNKSLYQDDRNNACFCGKDYDGEIKYSSFRGTLSDKQFRGEASGSHKEVGFTYNVVNTPVEKLFVTESPIDVLSIMSMLKNLNCDYTQYSFLSLGGTSDNALLYHLAKHPEIHTIYLCQDNDPAGHKSREQCRNALQEKGFTGRVIDKPPVSKDFNDDLAKQKVPQIKHEHTPERTMQHVQVNEP